ncbi:uncharacterized protein EI97DRAFT_382658, partial [Westerdykella ornata]
GGCRCGNVRYESSGKPSDITLCYCGACQQLSGSGYLPFVDVPTDGLTFTASSTLKSLRLSDVAERSFCSSCGSPISMRYMDEMETTGITMGSVDVASVRDWTPKIRKHIFLGEKAAWTVVPDDGSPWFEGFSDGRGKVEPFCEPR